MKLQVATLADDALRDAETGKLTIVRCYDQLRFESVPATVPTSIALIFRPTTSEINAVYPLVLSIVEPDGHSDILYRDTITPSLTPDGAAAEVPIPISLPDLTFRKFGAHRIDIVVAGKLMGDIEVNIVKKGIP